MLKVDRGDYFCINRARQYGKTTILSLLKEKLENEYAVFSISFEGVGQTPFTSGETLAYVFLCLLKDSLDYGEVKHVSDQMKELIEDNVMNTEEKLPLIKLSNLISKICMVSDKPVVLFIDEVDQAGNYSAFLEFLGLLRDKYLKRMERPAFWTVILAGVYDVKNLKLKIRTQEEHQYNSPWNIAADFHVNMDFSQQDIEGMLTCYETDYKTGMSIKEMSKLIYDYTSGYPFLVSRLCKIIDETIIGMQKFPDRKSAWSKSGFLEAEKQLLAEPNTLFDDMRKKLSDYPDMKGMLYELLYEGRSFPYNIYDKSMDIADMFGYIKNHNGTVMVSNRIFETWLYNLFIAQERMQSDIYTEGSIDKNQFIQNGRLDMKRVLEKFAVHYTEIYGNSGDR